MPRIKTSCPLRRTSLLTHTTSGRSPRPSVARRSAVGRSGRNRSTSAPGYSTETGTSLGTAVRTVRAMNAEHITGTRDAREVARRISACVPGAIESQYSKPCAAARYGRPPAASRGPRSASGYVAPNSTTSAARSAAARSTRLATSGVGHRKSSGWRNIAEGGLEVVGRRVRPKRGRTPRSFPPAAGGRVPRACAGSRRPSAGNRSSRAGSSGCPPRRTSSQRQPRGCSACPLVGVAD